MQILSMLHATIMINLYQCVTVTIWAWSERIPYNFPGSTALSYTAPQIRRYWPSSEHRMEQEDAVDQLHNVSSAPKYYLRNHICVRVLCGPHPRWQKGHAPWFLDRNSTCHHLFTHYPLDVAAHHRHCRRYNICKVRRHEVHIPPHEWGSEVVVNVCPPPIRPSIVGGGGEVKIHRPYQFQNVEEGTGIGLGDVVDPVRYR